VEPTALGIPAWGAGRSGEPDTARAAGLADDGALRHRFPQLVVHGRTAVQPLVADGTVVAARDILSKEIVHPGGRYAAG
jgi:hypothetical protein